MADTLSRIKDLEQERSRLIEDAKKEALGRAQAAISELSELGFEYQLVEGRKATRKAPAGRGGVKATACPICGFQTEPPHDARKHRSQGDNKRPFTAKQLSDLGLAKVEAGDLPETPKRGKKRAPLRRASKQQDGSEPA